MEDADWDFKSHQPYPLPRARKRELRSGIMAAAIANYARAAASLTHLPSAHCKHWAGAPAANRDFCGLALGLDEADAESYAPVIEDLDCRHLLLRIPAWHLDRLDDYRRLLAAQPQRQWLITVLQDRSCIDEPQRWRDSLRRIVGMARPFTPWFQIGQAPNRIKWGCAHAGEYRRLWSAAEELRAEDPSLRFAGPALLDFEPMALAAACAIPLGQHFDACTLGLYVDRRGSPRAKQAGFFDLLHKIKLLAAIARASGRCAARLWISETNWPLSGNGDHAPACEEYRVDEATYTRYMLDYLRIARESRIVERVYWWQPIAKGYGLIDGLSKRKRPAYFALKRWLNE